MESDLPFFITIIFIQYDVNFMRKIPQGAEGFMVLVGEVDFLAKPINAFVRLEDAQIIGDLLEVPIPTRFIFFMLGPPGQPGRYHEVGRAIGTLMSDEASTVEREILVYGLSYEGQGDHSFVCDIVSCIRAANEEHGNIQTAMQAI